VWSGGSGGGSRWCFGVAVSRILAHEFPRQTKVGRSDKDLSHHIINVSLPHTGEGEDIRTKEQDTDETIVERPGIDV
jgi:hypothetical protein